MRPDPPDTPSPSRALSRPKANLGRRGTVGPAPRGHAGGRSPRFGEPGGTTTALPRALPLRRVRPALTQFDGGVCHTPVPLPAQVALRRHLARPLTSSPAQLSRDLVLHLSPAPADLARLPCRCHGNQLEGVMAAAPDLGLGPKSPFSP